MPDYPGNFKNQVIMHTIREKAGVMPGKDKTTGDTYWFSYSRNIELVVWEWTGLEWIKGPEYIKPKAPIRAASSRTYTKTQVDVSAALTADTRATLAAYYASIK